MAARSTSDDYPGELNGNFMFMGNIPLMTKRRRHATGEGHDFHALLVNGECPKASAPLGKVMPAASAFQVITVHQNVLVELLSALLAITWTSIGNCNGLWKAQNFFSVQNAMANCSMDFSLRFHYGFRS